MLGRLILDRASEVPQAKKFKQFPLFSNQEIVRLTFTEARCSSEIYQGASKKTFPLNSKMISSQTFNEDRFFCGIIKMTQSQMGIWFIWRPSLDDILEDFGAHLYSNILYKQMIEIHISIITKFPIIHSGLRSCVYSRLFSTIC